MAWAIHRHSCLRDWCTIESDPGVFTSLCEEIGVKNIQFEEIYSLDPEAFAAIDTSKVYGLIFLFKWRQESDDRPTVDAMDNGLFFANQVIQNACATQAILSVLLNVDAQKLNVGPHLKEFKGRTNILCREGVSDRLKLDQRNQKNQRETWTAKVSAAQVL